MTTVFPARRVAVIGAGISGVVAAAHLLAVEGLDVTVFERNKAAGGVWLFDEREPIEPLYPSTKPSLGEEWGDDPREKDRRVLIHAPPGACYVGLENNVSTPLMRTTLHAWPEGTPDFVNHRIIKEYIQDASKKTGVDQVTRYGARVNRVQKEGSVWQVTWSVLHEDISEGKVEEREQIESFDAVVVGSGHYHAPRVPDIPGLAEAKTAWPSRITHSKRYRRPREFAGKNVLLIGGSVSAMDIARELGPLAKTIYQSTRNGAFDFPAHVLPSNGIRVDEIACFETQIRAQTQTPQADSDDHDDDNNDSNRSPEKGGATAAGRGAGLPGLSDNEPLPVIIHLNSGKKLHGIDHIIVCTGYHITFPFLNDLHEDDTLPENASETVLVTDGTMVHNLHKDIFYIPDPTLSFVGVPFHNATFTLFEFQAMVVSAVFSGVARLPSQESMKQEYRERLRQKGIGRVFHSLKGVEEVYVQDLLEWVNSEREVKGGLPPIEGHTPTWVEAKQVQVERFRQKFGPGHV